MPSEHIQQQLFWYGSYEEKYVLTWESFAEKDSIVIDIGANIGYYSLIAARKATGGTIYAFEPFRGSMEQLKANIALNQLMNVVPVEAAITAGQGSRSLFVSAGDNRGMTGFSRPDNFSGKTETVTTFNLDNWWTENAGGRIHLVKMDIEGTELQALQGMKGLLQKYGPVVFTEISAPLLNRFGNDPSQVFSFMKELGYAPFRIREPNVMQPINGVMEDELIVFLPGDYRLPSGISVPD